MHRHDPYAPIIEGLRQWNCCNTEEKFLERLRLSREEVKKLRIAYDSFPCNVDYSAESTRAAYLLAYYPYYIEIVYNELSKMDAYCYPSTWNEEAICGSFLGGGPCPEIIGWLAFLQEHFPKIRKVTAYVFDKYADSWGVGMNITQKFVAPCYWNGELEIRPIPHDLTDCNCFTGEEVMQAIASSSIVVMQNCLNDHPGKKETFDNFDQLIGHLFQVVEVMPDDSIFLMADLCFPRVNTVYKELERRVVNVNLAEIALKKTNNFLKITPNIVYPEVLNHLFIGEDRLIAKRNVNYYSMGIYKPFCF
jgi:hypothetical protein